jgi:uncharacterized membrane protein YhaH (DUF805 family)
LTDHVQRNIAEFKFCHGCGQSLHKSAQSCPSCGAQQPGLMSTVAARDPQSWSSLYFSANGRIGRQQWWISHLLLLVPLFLFLVLAGLSGSDSNSGNGNFGAAAGLIVIVWALIYAWSGICLNAKRWHDRDYSGWMQLVGIIPLVGIWVFIENGFLRGTEGPNRFGPNPLADR